VTDGLRVARCTGDAGVDATMGRCGRRLPHVRRRIKSWNFLGVQLKAKRFTIFLFKFTHVMCYFGKKYGKDVRRK